MPALLRELEGRVEVLEGCIGDMSRFEVDSVNRISERLEVLEKCLQEVTEFESHLLGHLRDLLEEVKGLSLALHFLIHRGASQGLPGPSGDNFVGITAREGNQGNSAVENSEISAEVTEVDLPTKPLKG